MTPKMSTPSDPPPLTTAHYTADPSAHIFNSRIYIYPSHDIPHSLPDNDVGDQYDMTDYHVFSLPSLPASPSNPVTDHGVTLKLSSVPWAEKQLWAPDAAEANGRYYLYFPAKDRQGRFRIGVAVGEKPEGPFEAMEEAIAGSFSIDPAVFVDDVDADAADGHGRGSAYMYFGGLWGGQLQCYQDANGAFDENWRGPKEVSGKGVRAQGPRVGRLRKDMLEFEEDEEGVKVREVLILAPETGEPILADDHEKRFFEASWMHKYRGTYYFSYSTGDTHYVVYATGDSPWGPFTYRGRILEPVLGWTTHHSIVEWEGRWWLFYHDASLSGGVNHLRSVKVKEIFYDENGAIKVAN